MTCWQTVGSVGWLSACFSILCWNIFTCWIIFTIKSLREVLCTTKRILLFIIHLLVPDNKSDKAFSLEIRKFQIFENHKNVSFPKFYFKKVNHVNQISTIFVFRPFIKITNWPFPPPKLSSYFSKALTDVLSDSVCFLWGKIHQSRNF